VSFTARFSFPGTLGVGGDEGSSLLPSPAGGSISSRREGSSMSAPGSSPGIGVSACGMATVLSVFRGKPFGGDVFRRRMSRSR
jgi:hypothetical protein